MPFYISPTGETYYRYNGTEYSGYGGPSDLVGVSGEYSASDQFNSGSGVNTNPTLETTEQRTASTTGHKAISRAAQPTTGTGQGGAATPEDNGANNFGTGAGASTPTGFGQKFDNPNNYGNPDIGA